MSHGRRHSSRAASPATAAGSGAAPRPAPWSVLAALLWLAAFVPFFFSFNLPNSQVPTPRSFVLQQTPWLLLDLIDPPTELRQRDSGWEYLPQRFDLLLVAGFILAGAWGLGHLVLRPLQLPLPRRCLERTTFAFAIGLSGLSLITLLCGLAGLLIDWLLGSLLLVALIGECLCRWRERDRLPEGRSPARVAKPAPRPRGQSIPESDLPRAVIPWRWGWWLGIAPFVMAMLLGAMLPSTDFDVNEYHFQGPKEYFEAGRISFLPHNVYTSFPFGTEMLTLLGMVLRQDWYRGALVGKTVLMAFAPLTALALYLAGRRWFSPTAGLLAAFIHLSTPWVYRISIIAYAEGGLTFFLFMTLFAVLLGVEHIRGRSSGHTPAQPPGWFAPDLCLFLLAGLLAGSAMACKYPGVLSVVIPLGLAIPVAVLRVQRSPSDPSPDTTTAAQSVPAAAGHRPSLEPVFLSAAVFALGVAITIGPWLLKNVAETGNPVYPLLYSVFGGRDWDDELNAKWKRGHSPDNHALSDLAEKFIDVTTKSDWLSPLLFAFAPLALIPRRTRRLTRGLWIYVGYLFLTWWIFTHRIDRFWVPLIPVVSLLAGAGAAWLWGAVRVSASDTSNTLTQLGTGQLSTSAEEPQESPASTAWLLPRRWITVTVFVVLSLFNLTIMTSALSGYNAYLLDLNVARTNAGTSVAAQVVHLNDLYRAGRLGPQPKVLCVGAAAVFDAEFPLVYNTVFDYSLFEQWCAAPESSSSAGEWTLRDPAEIRREFDSRGVTHVYVDWFEVLRYRQTYGYTSFAHLDQFNALRQAGLLGTPMSAETPLAEMSATQQQNIRRSGPELILTENGKEFVRMFEIYPVQSGE